VQDVGSTINAEGQGGKWDQRSSSCADLRGFSRTLLCPLQCYCITAKLDPPPSLKRVNFDSENFGSSILVPPLFVIVPLHFSWSDDGTVVAEQ